MAFSVVMSLATGTGAAIVLSTGVADSVTSEVPLDPVLTLGLVTLGFIALGWLVGPSLGNALFYLVKSKYKAPMMVVSLSDSLHLGRDGYRILTIVVL